MKKQNVMEFDKTLPEGFNGTFYFTNWTDEEFVGVWGKKEYVFPPKSTSPMIIPDQTQLEIQWIRKKFAKELAEKMFLNTDEWKKMFAREQDPQGMKRLSSIHQAASYSDDELTTLIQKCLEPLPVGEVKTKTVAYVPLEETLSTDEKGELSTVSFGSQDDPINELKKGRESLKHKNKI
jgi:hypothetical protein